MSSIKFMTVVGDPEAITRVVDLFNRFQVKSGVEIDPIFVDWGVVWRKLVDIGIHRRGADVVEVGTTWLESLVGMNALRPFAPAEIERFGGRSSYIPATWSGVSFGEDNRAWGIPLRGDVRVIWYWKDMLEEAGVDPITAFESISNTQQTLEKLKSVIDTPWGVTTSAADPGSIQALASWLWALGGDFVTPNCDKVLLMEPEALEAMRAYFGLYRYLPKGTIGFVRRNVAALVGGPWQLQEIPERDWGRLGIAMLPGPPFIGGMVLSIWQHTADNRRVNDVLNFIDFLVQPEIQAEYCPLTGLLPTRQEAWEVPAIKDVPYNRVMYEAFSTGRRLPSVPLWGMVEEKLRESFSMIWKDLLNNPAANVDRAIEKYLEPTVNRLNQSLK